MRSRGRSGCHTWRARFDRDEYLGRRADRGWFGAWGASDEDFDIAPVLALTVPGAVIVGGVGATTAVYILKAELGKSGSCHVFRHTMATLMLENGADIRFIQAMLGHAKLDTTQIYTQVSVRKLQEIHTATHPAKLDAAHTES